MELQRDTRKLDDFIKNYWEYYRELEKEFLETRRYVDFREDNFGTYSIEFLKLYQAVCSEIDVVGKALAGEMNVDFKPEDKKNNILKWWYEIQDQMKVTDKYYDSSNHGVSLISYSNKMLESIDIAPWEKFRVEKVLNRNGVFIFRVAQGYEIPLWWKDYNIVKHSRAYIVSSDNNKRNYSKANLKNVCYSFCALYSLEKAYMEAVGTQNDLEAFMDYSELFDSIRNTTSQDIMNLFA